MKSMLCAKVQRQNKHRSRNRFEKRADELIRDGEHVRDRKRALSLQLAQRNTLNIVDQKEPES
jgi:hypothetical protein